VTTLIAIYNSEGCVGRCDARCYNATGDKCTCCCGGRNHGKGQAQAIENTQGLADAMINQYWLDHPDIEGMMVSVPALELQQLSFDDAAD
jgi:hypothetical protein